MQKMMLVEFLQKHSTTMPLGDKPGARLRAGTDEAAYSDLRRVQQTNCHEPCRSPWMMEDTGGVRASAGRGRSIL